MSDECPLVRVVWVDSISPLEQGAWLDVDQCLGLEATTIESVGRLLCESSESVTLVSSTSFQTEQVSGVVTIPKSAIRQMHKLRKR